MDPLATSTPILSTLLTNANIRERAQTRYRNFVIVFPLSFYEENKSCVQVKLHEYTKYSYCQEEVSSSGFAHMQCFLNTKQAVTTNAVKRKFGVLTVQPVEQKDILKYVAYTKKRETRVPDGQVVEIGVMDARHGAANPEAVAVALLNDFVDVETALEWLETADPSMYLFRSDSIRRTLSFRFQGKDTADFATGFNRAFIDFTIPENKNRAHVLVGGTGYGKTQYALSHFKYPLLVTDRQDLVKLSSRTDGIIFDDMNFSRWDATNVLHLVNCYTAVSLNVKYTAARIPKYMPRFFLCNSFQLFFPCECLSETLQAIRRRCKIYELTEPLYDSLDFDAQDHLQILPGILPLYDRSFAIEDPFDHYRYQAVHHQYYHIPLSPESHLTSLQTVLSIQLLYDSF